MIWCHIHTVDGNTGLDRFEYQAIVRYKFNTVVYVVGYLHSFNRNPTAGCQNIGACGDTVFHAFSSVDASARSAVAVPPFGLVAVVALLDEGRVVDAAA
jgi:hypothetical protein